MRLAMDDQEILEKARTSAFDLLAHRARSEREMRQRLERKGYTAEVIEHVVAQLLDMKLLDDGEFAIAFARGRIRGRPKAPRIILRELRARGVAPETAELGMQEALTEESTSE